MKNLDQFKNYEVDSDLAATTEGGWGYPVLPGPSVPVLPGPSVPV